MTPKSETQVIPDLVAYLDGELSERDHGRVATAVGNSSRLQGEAARFERVDSLVAELERVTPSSDFADTFWQRLEREGRIEHESQLARWHRKWSEWQGWFIAGEGWKEWLSGGLWTPALVPVASLLIILATLFSGTLSTSPPGQLTQSDQIPAQEPPRQLTQSDQIPTQVMERRVFSGAALPAALPRLPHPSEPLTRSEQIPAQVVDNATFFRDYWLTARLERWEHFDEIMQTQAPRRPSDLAREQVPPRVIENPNFFMHYQIFRRMKQFQHFESVQSVPFDQADRRQG